MAFDTLEAIEDEDFYTITLSFRPQGNFSGTPGQEQFFIEKEGRVAVRQVLSLPRRGRRFPVLPVAIGVVIVGVIVAVGAVFMLGGTSDDAVSVAVVTPTETPVATEAPTPTPNASSYYNKGADYSNGGKYQLAVDEYTKAIQLDPDYLFAYNNRGNAYIELGEYQTAIEDYDKAIQLDPDYARAYNNRGIAYRRLSQDAEADADLTKACSLDSKYC